MDNQLIKTCFQTLYQLPWDYRHSCPPASSGIQSWLQEQRSMTLRLKKFCQQLTVEVVQEQFYSYQTLLEYERQALFDSPDRRFWMREVLLCGDGVPWLAGRTIFPESSLDGAGAHLLKLGPTPLGQFLFSAPNLQRIFLQIANKDQLWGRRSLFKMGDAPLLLTELFLPDSPAYQCTTEE